MAHLPNSDSIITVLAPFLTIMWLLCCCLIVHNAHTASPEICLKYSWFDRDTYFKLGASQNTAAASLFLSFRLDKALFQEPNTHKSSQSHIHHVLTSVIYIYTHWKRKYCLMWHNNSQSEHMCCSTQKVKQTKYSVVPVEETAYMTHCAWLGQCKMKGLTYSIWRLFI